MSDVETNLKAMRQAVQELQLQPGDNICMVYRVMPVVPTQQGPVWLQGKGTFVSAGECHLHFRDEEGASTVVLYSELLRVSKATGLKLARRDS